MVPDDVILMPTASGLLLERRISRPGRAVAFVERTLRVGRRQRFELDRVASDFYKGIDGVRTLAEIEHELRRSHDMTPDQGREAVTQFTKELLERGLVLLRLDG
jgi:hypothetical protein